MKCLILNGSRNEPGILLNLQKMLTDELSSKGHEIETLILNSLDIEPCHGCFDCWFGFPVKCSSDDTAKRMADSAIESNLLAMLTPITFGGYSSELKKAVDRLVPFISPYFVEISGGDYQKRPLENYPAIIGIGTLSRRDYESERIFESLVRRNAVIFQSPSYASGVFYQGDADELHKEKIADLLVKTGFIHEPR